MLTGQSDDASQQTKKLELPIKILVGTKSDKLFENAEQRLFTQEEDNDSENETGTMLIEDKKSKPGK